MDIEFEQPRSRSDGALVDVSLTADDRVVGGDHHVEEVAVQVVEPGPRFGHEAFTDERTQRGVPPCVACQSAGPNSVGGVRCNTTWSFGRISSINFHSSVGTPATSTRHSSGWFAVPVTCVALRGRHGVRLVFAGMEYPIGSHRVAVPVEHFQRQRRCRSWASRRARHHRSAPTVPRATAPWHPR